MYHRHSTSSTGSTEIPSRHKNKQQSYSFKRPSPTLIVDRRSSSSSQIDENNVSNISFSSFPDADENFYNKNDSTINDYNYNNNEYNDYDDKYYKRSGNNSYISNKAFFFRRILSFLILVTIPWIPCCFVRKHVQSKKVEILTTIGEQKKLVTGLDETTAKIKEVKLDLEMITNDNELSYQEIRRNGNTPEILAASVEGEEEKIDTGAAAGAASDMEGEEYEKREAEEEVLVQRIDALEKSIQKSAQKRLNERYGNGNYRFKVNVRDQKDDLSWFVIETAMLVEMPHAIDHFFKMVEKKLWDGLAIVHEPHSLIVTATPMMMDESHTWAGQRFVDANLTHMSFTEHSPTFPPPHHRLYTVAFSGRPGGPSFYISLQNELDYAHEQESTFGVIMEGRDTLYKFFLQKDNGYKKILTIESIDILETKRSNNDSNEKA